MSSVLVYAALIVFALPCASQTTAAEDAAADSGRDAKAANYVVGPGDQLKIWVLGLEDVFNAPLLIDAQGSVTLPLVGRFRVAGWSVDRIRTELTVKLKSELKDPQITVSVTEYRSQPVSVLGAVNNPGVHYLQGPRTLNEVLALAGGLRPDAGHAVRITRRIDAAGRLPLQSAEDDQSVRFSIGQVPLRDLVGARNPEDNIDIRSNDVITVPRAEVVYVVGEVAKAGGFVLNEREQMSSIQALAMAGGTTPLAAPANARILRSQPGSDNKVEIPLNLAQILKGKAPDVPLRPEDVLFIPNSAVKRVTSRVLETSLNLVTGVIIWRR